MDHEFGMRIIVLWFSAEACVFCARFLQIYDSDLHSFSVVFALVKLIKILQKLLLPEQMLKQLDVGRRC